MSTQLKIIITSDGSHSLFNEELGEVYHSKNGAMAESTHVFLQAGFEEVGGRVKPIRILEVGYGTGLNAFLTAVASYKSAYPVEYSGLEPIPVNNEVLNKLNYGKLVEGDYSGFWEALVKMKGSLRHVIHPYFTIGVSNQGLEDKELNEEYYHLVYFDAFAPEIQPGLWEESMFAKLFKAMEFNGILVTYSAKGSVRRSLQSAGFKVERLPGPAGKREMLRAVKAC